MKYGVGDYFGELALLNNEPRAASIIAITDCKVVSIDGESFKVRDLYFLNFLHKFNMFQSIILLKLSKY